MNPNEAPVDKICQSLFHFHSNIIFLKFQVPVQNTKYIPNSQHSMTWTEYHKQEDIESFLDYLADTYDFVEVESIGVSHEERPLRVIKVIA